LLTKAALVLLLRLAPALQAAESQKFTWDESWPRFSTAEYVVTGLAAAGSAAEFFLVSLTINLLGDTHFGAVDWDRER
jgi:hypothetical protein